MNLLELIEKAVTPRPDLTKDMAERLKTHGSVMFPEDEVLTGDPGGQKAGMVLSPKNIAKIAEIVNKANPSNNAELVWAFLKAKYPKLTSLPSKMTTDQQAAFMDIFGSVQGAYNARSNSGWMFNLFNKVSPRQLADTGMHETGHAYQNVVKGRKQELLPPSEGGTYHTTRFPWTVFQPKDPDLVQTLKDQAFKNYQNQPVEVQARAFGNVAGNTMQKFLDMVDPRQLLRTEDQDIPKWVLEQAGERIKAFRRAKAMTEFEKEFATGKTTLSPERNLEIWDRFTGARPFEGIDLRVGLGRSGDPEEAKILRAFLESAGFTDFSDYGVTKFLGNRTASQPKTVFPQWKE